ncbi:MAG: glycosyl hydrolase family 17 [candidate division Zixibacteria bacterium]|nr:glycosyl hydrolase family 17 [candidate division Zixibacteria bacterium]
MTNLRTELESGLTLPRQDPFKLRSFKPYLGDSWIGNAVAYGCYRAGQAPGQKSPSDAELLEDLKIIAGHWNLIRTYGADHDTKRILQLIETYELPIKVVQGIWLEPEEDNPAKRKANIDQVMLGIELAKTYPDIVIAISVANETQVFWSAHKMNPENLIRYIRAVRNNTTVPVTTADDYLYWNKSESSQIAEEIDFVFTHIHPLWNGKTLDEAVSWTDRIYRELRVMHPDRDIVIGETGWATDYNPEKTGPGEQGTLIKGDVGIDAQAEFLIVISRWIDENRVVTFIFEAFDEPWKGGEGSPPNEIEKNWGVYNEDRTPKESFLRYLDHQHTGRE